MYLWMEVGHFTCHTITSTCKLNKSEEGVCLSKQQHVGIKMSMGGSCYSLCSVNFHLYSEIVQRSKELMR